MLLVLLVPSRIQGWSRNLLAEGIEPNPGPPESFLQRVFGKGKSSSSSRAAAADPYGDPYLAAPAAPAAQRPPQHMQQQQQQQQAPHPYGHGGGMAGNVTTFNVLAMQQ
eukprot:RCo033533